MKQNNTHVSLESVCLSPNTFLALQISCKLPKERESNNKYLELRTSGNNRNDQVCQSGWFKGQ